MIDCKNEKSSNKIAIILIGVIVLALIAAFLPAGKSADTAAGKPAGTATGTAAGDTADATTGTAADDTETAPSADRKPLSKYWTEGSTVAQSLTEYVTKVTNPDDAANSPLKDYVTPNHVIGTDFEVKQKGHETEASNMNFKYQNGDELVLTGGFIQKNLNGNKSIYIEREIGQRPVLAFGNSGSDTSMMNYTIDDRNPYPAQAYMLVADDSVREWGKQDWAAKSAEYLEKGYIPISMQNDFAQIYEEGITKSSEQYQEPELLDAA